MNKRIVSFICMAWLVVGGMATGPVHATAEGGTTASAGASRVQADSGHGGAHGTPVPALAGPATAQSGGDGQRIGAATAGVATVVAAVDGISSTPPPAGHAGHGMEMTPTAPGAAGAAAAGVSSASSTPDHATHGTDHATHGSGQAPSSAPSSGGVAQAPSGTADHGTHGASLTSVSATGGAAQAGAPAAAGAMQDETHGDHGATTAPGKDLLAPADASHSHPVAGAASPAGVDEKLGAVIPQGIMFRDEAGNAIDVRSLMDVPTLIAPVYFSCPTVCNMLQSSIARVLPGVSLVPGKDYRVLSVSFDDLDTPALAASKKRNYLAAVGNDFPQDGWRFLTADIKELNRLMDAIGFRFTRQGRDFIHPVVLVAVAPGGKVVRYLYGNSFMPFDVTMALSEAAEGKVGLSVKRVLSYCFTYDPQGRKYVFDFVRIAGAVILFGAGVLFFVLIRGGRKQKANPGSPQEKQQ